MNENPQGIQMPKDKDFCLSPAEADDLSVVPTIAEIGPELEYDGVVRIGGAVFV